MVDDMWLPLLLRTSPVRCLWRRAVNDVIREREEAPGREAPQQEVLDFLETHADVPHSDLLRLEASSSSACAWVHVCACLRLV